MVLYERPKLHAPEDASTQYYEGDEETEVNHGCTGGPTSKRVDSKKCKFIKTRMFEYLIAPKDKQGQTPNPADGSLAEKKPPVLPDSQGTCIFSPFNMAWVSRPLKNKKCDLISSKDEPPKYTEWPCQKQLKRKKKAIKHNRMRGDACGSYIINFRLNMMSPGYMEVALDDSKRLTCAFNYVPESEPACEDRILQNNMSEFHIDGETLERYVNISTSIK
ncbi:hypothetical protein NHQ30_000225 [Ciborinia camelliae]|nr:hypothetical protein NHQ30_000225 [Ciborinia camelliae]